MSNNYFNFKQFSITQKLSAMKVGTDGVLLGAWANCNAAKTILDIGTGTGLIAIMMAQRSKANITAIEIETNAYDEATENVKNCKWNERITVVNSSLQQFANMQNTKYDLIVCNPPFFKNSKEPVCKEKTMARHNKYLNSNELIKYANGFLCENGIISLIIPAELLNDYTQDAENNNLHLIRKTEVKPTPEKKPKRLLLEFSNTKTVCLTNMLIVEEFGRHKYSDEYKQLTKDFYKLM